MSGNIANVLSTVANTGTITIVAGNNTGNSVIDQSDLLIAADATLTGGGSIVMIGGWDRNSITGGNTASATILHNIDNTISGVGVIGAASFSNAPANKLILDNQAAGKIVATDATQALVLNPLLIGNEGVLLATGAGGLPRSTAQRSISRRSGSSGRPATTPSRRSVPSRWRGCCSTARTAARSRRPASAASTYSTAAPTAR